MGHSVLWKQDGEKEGFSDGFKFLTTRDHEHLDKKIKKIYEGKSHGTWEKNWPNSASSKKDEKSLKTETSL